MTILSAQSIRQRHLDMIYADDRPMIDPFCERNVFDGKSYGLSSCGYDVRLDHDVELVGLTMQLAGAMERFRIPVDLCGKVHDKSSWARQGLSVFNTILEPGWSGFLTLELTLHKPHERLLIKAGTPIAQVQFETLDQPTEQPYTGKYQDQERGPVPARYER